MLEPEKEAVKLSWIQTRYLAFNILKPHAKNLNDPKQLGVFSFETEPAGGWTEGEVEAIDWDRLDAAVGHTPTGCRADPETSSG